MAMEMADCRLIDSLRRPAPARVRKSQPRPGKASWEGAIYQQPTSKARRICRCGTCPACIENARWERIFNEKFADPEYYSRKPPRHDSPLTHI